MGAVRAAASQRGRAAERTSALPDGSPHPSIWPADTRSRGQFFKGYMLRPVSGPGVAGKGVVGWHAPLPASPNPTSLDLQYLSIA